MIVTSLLYLEQAELASGFFTKLCLFLLFYFTQVKASALSLIIKTDEGPDLFIPWQEKERISRTITDEDPPGGGEPEVERMAECNHDCSSCQSSCASRKPESLLAPANAGSRVKRVIGVVSGKGGVGKSLVTGMLAVLMRRKGFETAVLDADITGPSIPRMFGAHERADGCEEGILPVRTGSGVKLMSINLLLENETDPVIWRGSLIAGTVKQFWTDVVWGDVDFMFVDMPPGTGDVPLTVFQSLPVDGIVIVASPQELVGMIVEKVINMAAMMHIPVLGVVENMSYMACPDCGRRLYPFGEGKTEAVAQAHGLPLLAQIPIEPALAALCDAGCVEQFSGAWMDEAAREICAAFGV